MNGSLGSLGSLGSMLLGGPVTESLLGQMLSSVSVNNFNPVNLPSSSSRAVHHHKGTKTFDVYDNLLSRVNLPTAGRNRFHVEGTIYDMMRKIRHRGSQYKCDAKAGPDPFPKENCHFPA